MSDSMRPDELEEYDENELIFHLDGRVTRKRFLLAGGAATLGAAMGPLLYSSVAEARFDFAGLPYKAHTSVKGHLEFWHFWSSPLRRGAIHSAIKQFQSAYKGIHVSDLPVPFGNIFAKLAAAVAAQSGVPDVIVANRPTFWSDAKHHLYVDLSGYNAKDHVSGKVFFPVTWQQCNVKSGKHTSLYGLPFETDIRVLYINRGALAEAGFSANAAPKTWSQLASMAGKLDKKSGGHFSQIAFWPIDAVGLDVLNWLANGDWTSSTRKNYPTANSSQNVQAGNWVRGWVDRYGGQTAYNALNAQSQPGLDMFASGLQVFHIDQPTYQDFTLVQHGVNFGIPSNSNSKISKIFPYWNVAYLPTASSKIKPWSFSGGFAIGVPRNKHRSSADTAAAWEFTKFMSLVGQLTFERFAGNIPCVLSQTRDSTLRSKAHWSTFIAALKYAHKLTEDPYDPGYPDDVIITGAPFAQNKILDGSMTPKQALDAAQAQALSNMKRNGGP